MSHRHLMTLLKSIDPSDPDFFSYLTFFLSLFTLSHSLFSLLSLSLSFSLTPPPSLPDSDRVPGLQLLYPVNEEDESELP